MMRQMMETAQALDRYFEFCLQSMMGQMIGITEVQRLQRGQGR
jgi:hypothetical protein